MPEEQERKKGNPKKKKKSHASWVVKIIFWTFAISMVMSIVSNRVLSAVDIFVAFFILLVFIAIGILFDIIGMSVATASEIPFHSMAAKKVAAASQALVLVRNAEKVSNFCNDVVGDICGIVSGSTGAVIATELVQGDIGAFKMVIGVVMTALISAFTVGGKAVGKTFATRNCNEIIYTVARVICFFKRPFQKKRG